MSKGKDQILRQEPNPDWHTELPEYYVVDGSSDMFAQMAAFADAGVRSVEVLSREEYDYLMKREHERLQKEAEGLVFAESEATDALKVIIPSLGTHQSATRKTVIRIKERTNPKRGTHQSTPGTHLAMRALVTGINVFTAPTGLERSGMKAGAVKTAARFARSLRNEII